MGYMAVVSLIELSINGGLSGVVDLNIYFKDKLQPLLETIIFSKEFVNEQGKSVTTMVWLRKPKDEKYEVEMERFYSTHDAGNIKEEKKIFDDLKEVIKFIELDCDLES
jgi:hypothetical protein